MALFKIQFDGGSFFLALLMLGASLAFAVDIWKNTDWSKSTGVVLCLFASIVFIWISVRLGFYRRKLREACRWSDGASDHRARKVNFSFDLTTFLLAVVMLAYAVHFAIDSSMHHESINAPRTVFNFLMSAGIFLFSLGVGDDRRKMREMRRLMRENSIGNPDN